MTDRTIVHDVQIITLTTTISAIFPLHNRARVVFVFLFTTVDQYFVNMKSFQ
jgi:hypothetical protein